MVPCNGEDIYCCVIQAQQHSRFYLNTVVHTLHTVHTCFLEHQNPVATVVMTLMYQSVKATFETKTPGFKGCFEALIHECHYGCCNVNDLETLQAASQCCQT